MQPADTACMYAAKRVWVPSGSLLIYLDILFQKVREYKGWGVGKETAKILLLHLPLLTLLFPLQMLCIVVYGFQDKILPL